MDKKELNLRHSYDKNADVLYVNFGDEEPTYIEEVENDFILLEIGWFTNLPKGIRVIGPKKNKVARINFALFISKVEEQVRNLIHSNIRQLRDQESIMERTVMQDINRIFETV